jgi:hypothetical protein
MSDEKKPGNGRVSLTAGIAALVAAGSLLVWVGNLSGEQGAQKEKVEQLEKRLAEDREQQRRVTEEIKTDIKTIGADVQTILRKITAIEAVRNAERRHSQ